MAVFGIVFKQETYTSASILHEILSSNQKHQTVDEDLNVVTFDFTSIKLLKCERVTLFLCLYMYKHCLTLNT